jgi:hypothetical protein
MKPTQYIDTKEALTNIAKHFTRLHPLNWYLRTTFECDHAVINKRKAILLLNDEKAVQKIILCKICCNKKNVESKNNNL